MNIIFFHGVVSFVGYQIDQNSPKLCGRPRKITNFSSWLIESISHLFRQSGVN